MEEVGLIWIVASGPATNEADGVVGSVTESVESVAVNVDVSTAVSVTVNAATPDPFVAVADETAAEPVAETDTVLPGSALP